MFFISQKAFLINYSEFCSMPFFLPSIYFLLAAFALDLYLAAKKGGLNLKNSTLEFCLWIIVAVIYGLSIHWFYPPAIAKSATPTLDYSMSYLLERLLSLDNVLVFLWIFNQLELSAKMRHRVLVMGIYGAIGLRILMIAGGLSLLKKFHPLFYLFGLLLIISGWKMSRGGKEETAPLGVVFSRGLSRLIPCDEDAKADRFWYRNQRGSLRGTRASVALICLLMADFVFALDSVPTVLAITQDPLIIYMTNCLALLGLRPAYLLIAHASEKFAYINKALAQMLILIGAKLLLSDIYHLSSFQLALSIIAIFFLAFINQRKATLQKL